MYWNEHCTDPPIGSHSLSKCWLETIMFEGHVAKVVLSLQKQENGHMQPTGHIKLFGWKEASVFRGFCSKHDAALFLNLDCLDIAPTTDDCMRLVYRSVCREASAKHHIVKEFHKIGMTSDERGIKSVMPEIAFGLQLFKYKFEIEQALASGNYSHYEHLIFDMSSRPHLLGTVTFTPLVTARGRMLGRNPGLMTLTVLPTQSSGIAILTWNQVNNPWGAKFAHALRKTPTHLLGMAIARVFIELSDSTCYSPVFWYGLPDEVKLWIIVTHFRSIQNREVVPPPDVLVPDYQKDWCFALPVNGFRPLE